MSNHRISCTCRACLVKQTQLSKSSQKRLRLRLLYPELTQIMSDRSDDLLFGDGYVETNEHKRMRLSDERFL